MRTLWIAAAVLLAGTGAGAAPADAIHRTVLQEQQFPPPNYHTVTVRTVIDPGGEVGSHTHPGAEMAFINAGTAALVRAGQPPLTLNAGDSFTIPPGSVHSLKNSGSTPLTIVSTYVVERGQPLASPVK